MIGAAPAVTPPQGRRPTPFPTLRGVPARPDVVLPGRRRMSFSMLTVITLLGWVGAAAGLLAYGMVSKGRWTAG